MWSIKSPHSLPSHRHFPWTTFLSLWNPLLKFRRLFTKEKTFSSTEIKMRAVAALSWYQWGWHLLRVINGGFEQTELFSLSGKSPEAASPELVSKRWYCANKSSGIQVLSKSLSLDCSTSPHGPRCWLELQPSQISSESRMEERTKAEVSSS